MKIACLTSAVFFSLCQVLSGTANAAHMKDTAITLDADVVMRFSHIPAGTFRMGSPEREPGRDKDESPQHEVLISGSFFLGSFEVTQREWMAVMDSNLATFQLLPDAPSRAMESISWNDCQAFISRLNKLGKGYFRLPTEAEWEYACRAGSSTAYHWGDTMMANGTSDYTWANSKSGTAPQPVGLKLPNAWGLYDMSGNVWEWCSDWYGPYSANIQRDPKGPETGNAKVFRGGSWYDFYQTHRSGNRHRHEPQGRYPAIGFRLVWEPRETE
jgi:formylglycine-generating enzyme required for sulfatase activity